MLKFYDIIFRKTRFCSFLNEMIITQSRNGLFSKMRNLGVYVLRSIHNDFQIHDLRFKNDTKKAKSERDTIGDKRENFIQLFKSLLITQTTSLL